MMAAVRTILIADLVMSLDNVIAVAAAAQGSMVLLVLGLVWQVLCSRPDATLPAPSKVWTDSYDLIVDPFFDRGGLDKGLFWHLAASLSRVAMDAFVKSAKAIATDGKFDSFAGIVSNQELNAFFSNDRKTWS